jgi:hypothetical protein
VAANPEAAATRGNRWLDHLTRLWLGGSIRDIENFESTVATRSSGDALQYRGVPSEASEVLTLCTRARPPSLLSHAVFQSAYRPPTFVAAAKPPLPSVTRSEVAPDRQAGASVMRAVYGTNRAQFSDTMTI